MIDFTRLKDIREDNDISQEKMSNILGVKRSTYSMWEACINVIPFEKLYKFARYFDYSIDYVLGLSNNRFCEEKCKEVNFEVIGNNMKYIRIKNGLSQKHIAEMLNVDQSCITKYEKSLIHISTANLYEFCKKFNITFEEICKSLDKS